MVENTEKTILDRINREPSYSRVLYKILQSCATPRSAGEIEREILSYAEMKTAVLPPSTLVIWLESAGGLESVSEKEKIWQTSEAGKKVLETQSPQRRLLELMAKEPQYGETYVQVLEFCQVPKTRIEIEEWVKANPFLQESHVYPAFLIQRLEDAGGIEWVDSHWRTTESGKGVCANISNSN
jgi:hypothetical protein